MFKKWFVIPALICLLGLPIAALAQDTPTPDVIGDPVVVDVTTPTPSPTPVIVEAPPPDPVNEEPGDPPATTPENLLGQLFQLLKDGTFIAWGAAGVVLIVGLLKIVAQAIGITLTGNGAIIVALVVQVIVWLGYSIANYFGQGETFQVWYLQIADVLRSLLPLAGLIFGSHVLYSQALKRSVPILGYRPQAKLR